MKNNSFDPLIQEFLEFKRATGFKYVKEAGYLKQFSTFCAQAKVAEPVLTKELAYAWCEKRPIEHPTNVTEQRITALRQFALYLVSMGHDAYIPTHFGNKKSRKSKYVAYVFSHEEITRIFEHCDKIHPHRRSTMHLVMPVLVRLLYSTGLRIMEGLKLQFKHVDFVNGILHIENAKYDRARLIPLSETMFKILSQYCAVMHPKCLAHDYLFIGITREPYTHHNIYLKFREVLLQAGIPHAGRGNGPRIHDIRHTYACHSMHRAVERKIDLYAALPILSTYMGHASIHATSQYLRMTAEVYPSIIDTVNAVCSYVIPEVKV
ncbi:MAG: tyrosine-type recombinase/integrase [Bacillota bacterium]|nr:tyrosine-type recombinase/integrase [Bacillota bacterium]